ADYLWEIMTFLLVFALIGCAFAHSQNVNLSDINSEYLRNIFTEKVSYISDEPIPTKCQMQLFYLSQNWKTPKMFPMVDSWGKMPIGMMYGNIYDLGNYEECINFNRKLPGPIGNLEGQYCRMNIPLISSKGIKENNLPINLVNENRDSQFTPLLKFGICIPNSCSPDEVDAIIPFDITNCKGQDKIPLEAADYVAIVIYTIIAVLLILGTAYDYFCKGSSKNQFLMAFSVPSNAEKVFHISNEKKKSNIECLNGLRVLSMMWIIYGHCFASNMALPKINYIDYNTWSKKFLSVFVYNPYIAVDSFFFMGGLVLAWIGMKEIEKRKGKLNILQMYLQRYLRLTPLLAFMILFIVSFMKYLENGPLLDEFIVPHLKECKTNWWMNLLYIQNYAAKGPMCIGPTWYLAVDFQLFLFSPLILYGFWRWGKKCFFAAVLLIALSVGCIYGTFYKYNITGVLLINGSNNNDRMDRYYYKTHTRYSIWIIGMCFGYILYQSKDKSVKIPWYTQIVGWIVNAGIFYGVTMAPQTTFHGFEFADISVFSTATYEAFSKIGWGFMLSWIIYACYHGYGGVINSFLSNPLWQPFARLSFSMFVSHMAIITIINSNTKTLTHFSDFESILGFWSRFGIIIICSIGLALVIELPMSGLVKAMSGKSNSKTEDVEERTENVSLKIDE
ncbi:hypothetical protein ACFFRR_006460, partial [Megaselia abdita]